MLGEPVRRNPGREQAVRVRLERSDGAAVAWPNGAQGSHILTSLIGADALALIPAGEGVLEAGATVALGDALSLAARDRVETGQNHGCDVLLAVSGSSR